MPAPIGGVTYSLKMVEVLPNQSPEEAMRSNPPWFERSAIHTTSLAYPVGARGLTFATGGVRTVTVNPIPANSTSDFLFGKGDTLPDLEIDTVPYGETIDDVALCGKPTEVNDARRDLYHLDEQVQAVRERAAAGRADRRQFMPLLAWQVTAYAEGTKICESEVRSFVAAPCGLAFDGQSVWVGGSGK